METSTTTPDITMTSFAFDKTEVTFTARTPDGRALMEQCFGQGAISATIRKSEAGDFIHFAERQGIFPQGQS